MLSGLRKTCRKTLLFMSLYDMFFSVLPITVGGSPFPGVMLLTPDPKEGVVDMITWQDLFMFCMFVIALISLVVKIR